MELLFQLVSVFLMMELLNVKKSRDVTRPGVISPESLEVHKCNYIDYISVSNTIVVVIDHNNRVPRELRGNTSNKSPTG